MKYLRMLSGKYMGNFTPGFVAFWTFLLTIFGLMWLAHILAA